MSGKPDDPLLAANSLDAVLISYAYHEMPLHEAILGHTRSALLPDGRLVVVEDISEKDRGPAREPQVIDHELAPETLEAEIKAAGFASVNGIETQAENGGVLRRRSLF